MEAELNTKLPKGKQQSDALAFSLYRIYLLFRVVVLWGFLMAAK
jgi:hypothetical protein